MWWSSLLGSKKTSCIHLVVSVNYVDLQDVFVKVDACLWYL